MEKEKVVFFLDYANISRAVREKRYRLNYHDLLHYVGEDRFLIDAYCYVPINPRNEHRLDRDIEELWRAGYIVNTKMGSIAGGTYRCNFDVEITMDIVKVVYQMKPDIIVVATSNADFVSLLQDVRKSGVRVEVAAFEETLSAEFLLKCSGFIDLAVYYEEYLAIQKSEQEKENVEELYKDLIQSQESDLHTALEDDRKLAAGREDDKTSVLTLDSIENGNENDADELDISISNNKGEHAHGDH